MMAALDFEACWDAVLNRDRSQDGLFVTGVLSTGIYCRPSCAARHPKPENIRFFATCSEARDAGLRPCLRCRPDEVARDEQGIAAAIRFIEQSTELPSLDEIAEAAGYAPHHFHRLFKRATGVTPASYAKALLTERAQRALKETDSVTEAIYDAGYNTPSRFYADAEKRLGMTPSAWRKGGEGVVIRWAIVPTSLGKMLVAATDRGICRLSFNEGEPALRERFPAAGIEPADDAMTSLVAKVVAAVEAPERPHDLPIDVRGTAFQEAVWRELSRIPAGDTLSYAALAAQAGNAKAVRATGSACGANPVAILIPCHRAKRTDGSLGGYAYGLPVKEELLRRERK